jgi:hypothetical protein
MLKKINEIYHHPYCPRFFYKKFDGGRESGVIGYFLIEWKILFSIGLLHFKEGSRENYHSHAFNACTWWLKGYVTENSLEYMYKEERYVLGKPKNFSPSIKPKLTFRDKVHKIFAYEDTLAITFRGPWQNTWFEVNSKNEIIVMTHGRKIIN